jgi:hypothetical protein
MFVEEPDTADCPEDQGGGEGGEVRAWRGDDGRYNFSKVLCIVTACSKYTRALTVESFAGG